MYMYIYPSRPFQAALCAVRLVQKAPDLMEMYVPITRSLLNEKNHGVLIGGVCLVTAICQCNPDSLSHFRRVSVNIVLLVVFMGSWLLIVCS